MKNSRITRLALAAGVAAGLPASPLLADIPPRPEQVKFKELEFSPPKAADYRHVLSNGVVVYLAPSHEFPLISLSFSFRGGDYLDTPGKIGLASATSAMMSRGGTTSRPPAEVDEQYDMLAAQVRTSAGDVESIASLNCLSTNFVESFGLFMEMLRTPGFDQARFDLFKSESIEGMKQRNDSADGILNREWNALLYGRNHYLARVSTEADLKSITVNDLRAMHAKIFNPSNLIIAVSGDFEEAVMMSRLEAALDGWEKGQMNPDPPAPTATFEPGVYHVQKDIPQGKVYIGLRSITREDPDYFPMLVLDDILGSGGFTSRITKRVRSDEGLAYSAGSRFAPAVYFPGEFRAGFQSKNSTVALAIKLIIEEFNKIRSAPVSAEELEVSQNGFIETFPRTFESKPAMLGAFVSDERTHRAADFWQTYRDKIRAVTAEELERVARKYLHPEEMAIMVVGDWDAMKNGDENQRASMAEFFGGNVTHLPLRDPLTQEPIEQAPEAP